jgi:hypothetical protein
MNKLKLFFATAVAMCMTVGNVFADTENVKDMLIAVIWNPETQNTDAPFGWNVGKEGNVPTSGNLNSYFEDGKWQAQWEGNNADAEEVSKAQLKFYLSSIGGFGTGGSLDTASCPEEGFAGAWMNLENVRIYRSDSNIKYKTIKDDFNGVKPNAIIYIDPRSRIEEEDMESRDIIDLVWEAAKDEVGILFIGQRSIANARYLDESGEVFPVMGVQKEFRIKQFGDYKGEYGYGDVIREFNFLDGNDYQGLRPNFKTADTVTISGNDDKGYKMYLIRNGKVDIQIYDSKPTKRWLVGDAVVPVQNILHQYGEWSIKAEAVEVIENDTYEAEMNYGFHREKDVWIGNLNGKVYIRAKESPSLFLNGVKIFNAGTELTASNLTDLTGRRQPTLNFNPSTKKVVDDWILEAENPESKGVDKIIVMHAGQPIDDIQASDPNTNEEWDNGTYIPMFNAGGLRDLRIAMQNTGSEIYKDIFTHDSIRGKTELKFKPYGSSRGDNGRIQAGASIWAFNEHLNLKSFSDLYGINGEFDKNVYYCDYFGDQMAGGPSNTPAQFVRPQASDAEFDNLGDSFRERELPATNPSNSKYYDMFSGKIYHQIAVVQHGAQRLAMVNYQPTYLEDAAASRAILHDITKWIGYNKYSFSDTIVQTSIGNVKKSNKKHGILLEKSIVSDKVVMHIIVPNDKVSQVKVVVYDNIGNAVFEKTQNDANVTWGLTNSAGRVVANGTYLIVAEVKGVSGKTYAYSAKVGVKR